MGANEFLGRMTNLHLSKVNPRPFFRFALDQDKNLTGVEIGVWEAVTAFGYLKRMPNIKKMYLVDPYITDDDYDGTDFGDVPLEGSQKIAWEKLFRWREKIEWIYKTSDDAVLEIPEKVDFVYIDGNHRTDFVKRDIENYWKIIVKGGVLGGHDIALPSVCSAICEFVYNNELELHVRGCDWWIYKK